MEENQLRELVSAFNTKDNSLRDGVWQQLRVEGVRVLPYLAELFPQAKRFEVRRDIAYHSIQFARTSDTAFRIGLMALNDRSGVVRYRGCCILAYSLRADALLALRQQLTHPDVKTVQDVEAAIDAIENRNHNLFVDRQHTGQVFWEVGGAADPEPDNPPLQRTGAAGIFSGVRKWFGRGPGR